jgi:hypothetical protein
MADQQKSMMYNLGRMLSGQSYSTEPFFQAFTSLFAMLAVAIVFIGCILFVGWVYAQVVHNGEDILAVVLMGVINLYDWLSNISLIQQDSYDAYLYLSKDGGLVTLGKQTGLPTLDACRNAVENMADNFDYPWRILDYECGKNPYYNTEWQTTVYESTHR